MIKLLSVLGSPRAGRYSSDLLDTFFNDPFFSLGKSSFSDDKVRFNTTNKQFTCEIDLPGVTKDNLKMTVEEDQVYINASRTITSSGGSKEESYNRSFGFDQYKFDVNKLEASLENGVLRVTVPSKKQKEKEVKIIEVK